MAIDRSKFKATPRIALVRQFINNDAFVKRNYFDEYIQNMDNFITTKKQEVENQIAESKPNLEKLDGDAFNDFYSFYETANEKYCDFNPSLFYHSVLIMLSSHLEISIRSLAENYLILRPDLKTQLGIKNLKSHTVTSCIKILNEFLPDKVAETFFEQPIFLRNKIVHDNGSYLTEDEYNRIKTISLNANSLELDDRSKSFKIVNASILYRYNELIEHYLRHVTTDLVTPKQIRKHSQ